jgi:glycosyltransferase involved in cell wall biosynthesis
MQTRVAIVHDYLWTVGGAEKVVEALSEAFPEAPIYTSFLLSEKMTKEGFKVDLQRVKTTWMQYLPWKRQLYKVYFLFYPLAFRSLNLKDYDVVVSSSSYAALHTTVRKGIHICYCHTPSRYLYGYDTELDHATIKKYLPFMKWIYARLRKWDQEAGKKVDQFVTNSVEVRGRIKKHYGRDSLVIYPPVETERFEGLTPTAGDYYFSYGRLVAHKRVDIVVEAFNTLRWPLKIAGTGLEYDNLKRMAKENIEFLGRVSDEELDKQLSGCKAVIFSAEEDFGIVPVEAMASGKAVIAFEAGGVLESVRPGVTGEFFSHQTADSLIKVLKNFDPKKYDTHSIRSHAHKFAKEVFITGMRKLVKNFHEQSRA